MFDSLNPAQSEAAVHEGGPLLIVAGAGSGKTLTLACRVAHLVERGVHPERILLLTFTRRAAREMVARAERMTGRRDAGRVWGGTFHAIANRLLRIHGRALGLPPDFTVSDRGDSADLMHLIRSELGLGENERRFPRRETLVDIYSRTVDAREPLAHVLQRHFPWCAGEIDGIRAIFEAYTPRKRAQHVLDFDDLLLFWHTLAAHPVAGPEISRKFDHVLVDEYQDTNALQADILAALRPGGEGLTVVGDDAQAIYGFRAATVRNILEFSERFPATRVVRLERNYRSTQPILDASNAVIAHARARHDKTMWTDRLEGPRPQLVTCLDDADEADVVCRAVLDHRERGTPLRHQAVLVRAGWHSDVLEVELARRNIPFMKYGGIAFMEAAHVKDLLALLRVLENPRDEVSWLRVLELLPGVGPSTARRLADAIGVGRTEGVAAPGLLDASLPVPVHAQPDLERLRSAIRDCRADGLPPATQIERIRRFLEPVLRRRHDDADARIRDLEQLEIVAAGSPSRARFLADLTLDPPAATQDLAGPPHLDEDYLILSTIHSAKGGEWDAVFVIHAADGMIPSDMALSEEDGLEEERRLLYVALTRARDSLMVTFPLRSYRRRGATDAYAHAQLSRFLGPDVRALMDEGSTIADEGWTAEPIPLAGELTRIDATLSALWGS